MFGCLTGWLCRYSRLRLVCCTTKLSFRCNICCWSRITDEAPQISGYNYQLICTTFHKDCMYSALLLWIVSISYTFFFTGFNCGTTLCPYTVVLRFFVPYQYKVRIYHTAKSDDITWYVTKNLRTTVVSFVFQGLAERSSASQKQE